MLCEVLKFRFEIFHLNKNCDIEVMQTFFWGGGQIPSDPHSNELDPCDSQAIESMCVSPAEETLAVSTDRGQLYSISLSAVDIKQVKLLYWGTFAHVCGHHIIATVNLHVLWFILHPSGGMCLF